MVCEGAVFFLRLPLRPHSLGSCHAMTIQPQLQPQRASIYLTFKIIQVVNQLRRRLKPRVSGSASISLLGTATSLGLESKALKTIAQGLSRVGFQERKQLHHASNRISKSRKKTRPSLKPQRSGDHNAVRPNTSGEEVQQYVPILLFLLFRFTRCLVLSFCTACFSLSTETSIRRIRHCLRSQQTTNSFSNKRSQPTWRHVP